MTSSSPDPKDPKEAYFAHLLNGDISAASQLKAKLLTEAKFLYRYRALSGYPLEELITGRTYLARPAEFHDPYECRLLMNVTGKYKTVLGSAWSAFHYLEKHVRCAALCEDPRLVLMWAHYANCPHGCCLEYRTAELLGSASIAPGLHPVVYADTLYDANESLQGAPERLKAILLRMACHKLRPWDYEREWRLVNLEVKEPSTPGWPGLPMDKWAPNLKIDEQSQTIGYADAGNRYVDFPVPTRIILLGEKVDADLERVLRGIARLSGVPFALAELTPDAETTSQLEIRDV